MVPFVRLGPDLPGGGAFAVKSDAAGDIGPRESPRIIPKHLLYRNSICIGANRLRERQKTEGEEEASDDKRSHQPELTPKFADNAIASLREASGILNESQWVLAAKAAFYLNFHFSRVIAR